MGLCEENGEWDGEGVEIGNETTSQVNRGAYSSLSLCLTRCSAELIKKGLVHLVLIDLILPLPLLPRQLCESLILLQQTPLRFLALAGFLALASDEGAAHHFSAVLVVLLLLGFEFTLALRGEGECVGEEGRE